MRIILTGDDILQVTGGEFETAGNIDPSADDTYDLGDTTTSWQDLYLTGNLCFDDTDCAGDWASGGASPWNYSTPPYLYPDNATDFVGIGTTTTSEMHGLFTVSGKRTGKALAIFNETGDQDILVASSSGTARFVVDNSGNVGIGTTDPGALLHLSGDDIQFIMSDTDIPANRFLAFDLDLPGENIMAITVDQADALVFGEKLTETDRVLENEWIRITNAGNVGIGTTAPSSMLHIGNTDYADYTDGLTFGDGDTGFYENADDTLIVAIGGNDRWRFDNTQMGYLNAGSIRFIAEAPSATNPGLMFQGDDDTGIGRAGADILSLIAGGTNVLNVTNGEVGIGTTGPAYNLEIQNTADAAIYLEADTDDVTESDNAFIKFSQDNAGVQSILGTVGTAGFDPENVAYTDTFANSTLLGTLDSNGILHFGTNDAVRMTIEAGGDVGIGTTSPTEKLEVVGDVEIVTGADEVWIGSESSDPTNRSLYLLSNGESGIVRTFYYNSTLTLSGGSVSGTKSYIDLRDDQDSGGYIAFAPSDSEAMRILNNGNVGIGTTSPTSLLHVEGAVAGKALAMFNYTGTDQDIITASESGTTRFRVTDGGNIVLPTSSNYLNFDSTEGTSGYGIRDNAGAMEFKDSGGSWAAFGSGSGEWTLSGTTLHPILATTDVAVGVASDTLVAPFSVDENTNTVRIGQGSGGAAVDAVLTMYDSSDATGSITYTSDTWNFTGGSINLDGDLDLDSNSATAFTVGDTTNTFLTVDATADAADTLLTLDDVTDTIASGNIFSLVGDGITTGNVLSISADALSGTGNALYIESTTTSDFTEALSYMYWNPGSATTATGDILKLNIGANATLTGNILGIYDNGSDIFKVSTTQIESAIPHAFTAAGDVTMAYDLEFTNQTSSSIISNAPFTIDVGESFESNNLTLKTYNSGNIVIDNADNGKIATFIGSDGSVEIADGGLCVADGDDCPSPVDGTIRYDTDDTSFDIAEFYLTNTPLKPANIVVTTNEALTVGKTNQPYDANLIGIVSTSPNIVFGTESDGTYSSLGGVGSTVESNRAAIALIGRVPVKISNVNGPINHGDLITTSSISGYAMKATKPGFVVGKALESFDPGSGQGTTEACPPGSPANVTCGLVTVYVDSTWYDPDIYFTATGDLNIEPDALAEQYVLRNTQSNNLFDRIAAISEAFIANLTAGTINAQEISTNALAINGQAIGDYINNLIAQALESFDGLIAGSTITSPLVETDNLQARLAQTDIISPLSDGNLTIDLADETEPSGFGTLIVEGDLSTRNASISAQLTAQDIQSDNLETQEATISGTLYADNIESNQLSTLDDNYTLLSSDLASQSARLAYFEQMTQDQLTALSQEPTSQFDEQTSLALDDLAAKHATISAMLAAGTYTATDSAQLDSDLTLTSFDSDFLSAKSGFFTENLSISGFTQTTHLEVTDTFVVKDNLLLTDLSISTLQDTLYIQPVSGSVNLAASTLIINPDGTIDINANVHLAGDLEVEGDISGQSLSLAPDPFLTEAEIATSSAKLLSIIDYQGKEIAGISATGSATFASITTDKLSISSNLAQTESQTLDGYVIETDSTAGQAIIPAGLSEVTIKNPQVATNSLVYVTPTSSTDNQVLYVKDQNNCQPDDINCEPSILVGFETPTTEEVAFNWWIVDLAYTANN